MFSGLNLGNFGGQLSIGDLNGALKATGAKELLPDPSAQMSTAVDAAGQAAGAPTPPQAADSEVPGAPAATAESDGITAAPLKGVINMQTIGQLIGSYFGGPIGGQIGGQIGGMAKSNVDKQKRMGVLG